jgi:hypothetical protein
MNMNLNLLWIIIVSLSAFGVSAIFAGWLKFQRNVYLLFYIPTGAAIFILFMYSNHADARELFTHNWYWGLLGAVVAAAFVIRNVLSQPSSEKHSGFALISDIIWPGFTYGLIDSLLLSVIPIVAVQLAFNHAAWANGWVGKIGVDIIALLASLFVTVIYHLGYPEFRGTKVIWPVIGNGVLSLAFLLTMSPLAAILPHIAMHITAMIHGRETTGQVPPHYNKQDVT